MNRPEVTDLSGSEPGIELPGVLGGVVAGDVGGLWCACFHGVLGRGEKGEDGLEV